MNQHLKILIVDRAPVTAPTIREQLGKTRASACIHEASAFSDILFLLKDIAFDMIIYDSLLAERMRLSLLRIVRAKYPRTRMVPFYRKARISAIQFHPENLN
jgi:DNA-binding NarL/FixJ family response regulator